MTAHATVVSARINFHELKAAASPFIFELVARWLPDGYRKGREWYAKNPRRVDHSAGSFHVNITTGVWADYATGDSGDIIQLACYLHGITPAAAADGIARAIRYPS